MSLLVTSRYRLLPPQFEEGSFDIRLIEKTLLMPERRPAYRQSRSHEDFLMNLPFNAQDVTRVLREEWGAASAWDPIPSDAVRRLVETQYGLKSWNEKF